MCERGENGESGRERGVEGKVGEDEAMEREVLRGERGRDGRRGAWERERQKQRERKKIPL